MKKSFAIFLFASSLVAQVQLGKNVQIGAGSSAADFITSLTTTGTSGPASVTSGVLNIPQYTFNFTLGSTSITGGSTITAVTGLSVNGVTLNAAGSSTLFLNQAGGYTAPGGGGGAVSSVANSDGTLTISPTTGAVVASLNLAHANTWTAPISVAVAGGQGGTVDTTEGTAPSAVASHQILNANASTHTLNLSSNGGAFSPICTVANALCASGGGGFPITLGSTSIASGSTTTTLAGLTLTAPTFTTPALGTPASGVATNLTGLPLTTGVTGVLPRANGGFNSTSAGTGILRDGTTPAASELSGDATTSGSNVVTVAKVAGTVAATIKTRDFGTTFGDTGGSALSSGSVVYFTIPYACTIGAWNMAVDAGTATIDIWKIASGTAIPTVTNTITASALPAISTGTALHSTTLTGWTTAVTANDIFGVQLKTVATAKFVEVDLQCNQ